MMHLKLIPPSSQEQPGCMGEVLCLPGAGAMLQRRLLERDSFGQPSGQLWVPSEWLDRLDQGGVSLHGCQDRKLSFGDLNGAVRDGLLITNARFACDCDPTLFKSLLDSAPDAVTAIDIAASLAAPRDLVRTSSKDRIVGMRRILTDRVEPSPQTDEFPNILYFPPSVCRQFGPATHIPLEFEAMRRWLSERNIPIRRFCAGGQCLDLESAGGILQWLSQVPDEQLNYRDASARIDSSARLIGTVWVGRDVRIEQNALVVGPAILCENVHVGADAVVGHSIIAPTVAVASGQRVQDTISLSQDNHHQVSACAAVPPRSRQGGAYRDWPLLSYARFGKRLFDVIFSLFILMLVSPIFLAAIIMIKLSSPGPIFYSARRQGRHGREFGCLKFRTMMINADNLQEKLRDVNEVDGPQFKMDNDPRITGVGKFLRDTCIDELPQFINVLLGQMSVVGPRPSPENENDSCPAWRDARLSVRPGITGLWQMYRTRQEGMDFQEWVFYDTKYVRNLSFRQDLWICLKTAHKLIHIFLDQFG